MQTPDVKRYASIRRRSSLIKTIKLNGKALYLAVIIIVAIWLAGERDNSRFLLLLFPPADLYKPLVYKPLDLSLKGNKITESFQFSYPGDYIARLYIQDGPTSIFDEIESKAQLMVKFQCGSTEKKINYTSWDSVFISTGTESSFDSGVSLAFVRVPDEFPVNELCTFELRVVEPDIEFNKNWGPFLLKIQNSVM